MEQNIGQAPLPEAWVTSFAPLSAQVRHRGGALHSLATCDAPPHPQQASFLPGSVQPRDTWPYPWHLKHWATSTCSRMRQFTHPSLSLPNRSKLWASASVKRTTAVCTPPKRLYSLNWSPRSGFPRAMHSAATTSSLVTVSSRSLTSRDLFETKDLNSSFFPTVWSSAFRRSRRHPPFWGPGGLDVCILSDRMSQIRFDSPYLSDWIFSIRSAA